MNWDVLLTLGTLLFIPGLMLTLLNREAYVPRLTSAVSVVGLTVIIVALIGAGLVLSPIVSTVIAVIWVFIFVFRGKRSPFI
ncbi:MAG: hypothetical protein IIA91_05865 [Chloroflexi bacterium]|nr:hypothetical protein [Chloroflexota bacterium]